MALTATQKKEFRAKANEYEASSDNLRNHEEEYHREDAAHEFDRLRHAILAVLNLMDDDDPHWENKALVHIFNLTR